MSPEVVDLIKLALWLIAGSVTFVKTAGELSAGRSAIKKLKAENVELRKELKDMWEDIKDLIFISAKGFSNRK